MLVKDLELVKIKNLQNEYLHFFSSDCAVFYN